MYDDNDSCYKKVVVIEVEIPLNFQLNYNYIGLLRCPGTVVLDSFAF